MKKKKKINNSGVITKISNKIQDIASATFNKIDDMATNAEGKLHKKFVIEHNLKKLKEKGLYPDDLEAMPDSVTIFATTNRIKEITYNVKKEGKKNAW